DYPTISQDEQKFSNLQSQLSNFSGVIERTKSHLEQLEKEFAEVQSEMIELGMEKAAVSGLDNEAVTIFSKFNLEKNSLKEAYLGKAKVLNTIGEWEKSANIQLITPQERAKFAQELGEFLKQDAFSASEQGDNAVKHDLMSVPENPLKVDTSLPFDEQYKQYQLAEEWISQQYSSAADAARAMGALKGFSGYDTERHQQAIAEESKFAKQLDDLRQANPEFALMVRAKDLDPKDMTPELRSELQRVNEWIETQKNLSGKPEQAAEVKHDLMSVPEKSVLAEKTPEQMKEIVKNLLEHRHYQIGNKQLTGDIAELMIYAKTENPTAEDTQSVKNLKIVKNFVENPPKLTLQEQALKDGDYMTAADEKVRNAEWELAKQPNNSERQQALKTAQAERVALHDEIKQRVTDAMDKGTPYVIRYDEVPSEPFNGSKAPIELVVTQKGNLRLAIGAADKPHNLAPVDSTPEIALNTEQRSTPERVAEVLKQRFNAPKAAIPDKIACINYLNADKVFSENEIKDALNKALKSSFQAHQTAAIKSPVMRAEWLEHIATSTKVPEPIRQAAKNEMTERFGTAKVKQDALSQPETAKKQTADKGGVSLGAKPKTTQSTSKQQAVAMSM
ncbi:MAG: hypothetical protein IKX14_08415, partial [Neisseriaceae bacterium]|nr:hypothetical protein [Neisseriaceae bacterium]